MSYKNKYLKYKQKYLELKNQYGGDYNDTIIEYLSNKSNQIKPEFNNRHFFNNFNLHNLFITHDLKTIDKIYKKNKYLQLRKYNNEKKLIIGCGNKRLDNRNIDNCIHADGCNQIFENVLHSHIEAFTIDMTLVANPSIVAEFNGHIIFETIPDNSFDIIIFEGGGDPNDNPLEIKRLLNKNNLSFCICNSVIDGKMIIYSYWSDNKYIINKY